jgi:flagellar basal-body rod modification protein FlgD
MTNISNSADFWAKYSVEGKQAAAKAAEQATNDPNAMGQTEFLELMMAQLENQDPLSPQDNTEFIAQLAQFSSVEGIQSMNSSVNSLVDSFKSSQALQASALVGRKVQIEGNAAMMKQGEGLSGALTLPEGTRDVQAFITDSTGQVIKEFDLTDYRQSDGSYPAGKVPFEWDGMDADGNPLPAGTYSISANANVNGNSTALASDMNVNVDSVTMGTGGQITLNLAGYGSVGLSDVKEFH